MKNFSRRKFLSWGGILAAIGIGGYFSFRHFSSTVLIKVESFATNGNGQKQNILVLTGSAREHGNSEILADAFVKGAREAGHVVNIFQTGMKPMSGCLHCDACWSAGTPCVIDDSFKELWPMLENAEILVICSPLYWYNFSGHIKCAIDRFYPYFRKNRLRNMKVKEAILLMCGESILPRSFAGAAESYRQILGLNGWKDRGRLFATGIHELGDMAVSKFLPIAEEMGRNA